MPRVTRLTYQKNNPGRVSVFIDGVYSFSLPDLGISRHGLKVGSELTPDDLEGYRLESAESKLYDQALTYASRYMCSSQQLVLYLRKHGATKDAAWTIAERLILQGRLDDLAYAKSYVRDGIRLKQRGKKRLGLELRQKGIPNDIIQEAFSQLGNEEELDALRSLVQKKLALAKYQDQNRLMRYLSTRGYQYDDIKQVIYELSN